MTKDHNGIAPADVVGRRFIASEESEFTPSGEVVDAHVDGVGIMMLTILRADGDEVEMVPLTLGALDGGAA